MHGDHCESESTAWWAIPAAALARSSTLKSSSCVATPPPKSLDGLPTTLSKSEMVLSYWLGVSRRACSAGACGALQSMVSAPPPLVVPALSAPPAAAPTPPDAPAEEALAGDASPLTWHAATARSAAHEGKRAILRKRLRAFMVGSRSQRLARCCGRLWKRCLIGAQLGDGRNASRLRDDQSNAARGNVSDAASRGHPPRRIEPARQRRPALRLQATSDHSGPAPL